MSVQEDDVIRLGRSDARMVRWMCKFRPKDRISGGELRNRLKLKSMRNYLQDWKEWKGVLGILDVESSKLVVFPPRELPIKT